jgi:sec-independent protein translocase protein TatA
MPNIGPLELIIILAVLLLIFGPKRLPGLGKQLGSGMREFKESITGKDRDDDDQHEQLPASTDAPAARREPEVVTAEARPEDQPEARRAD